MKELAAWDGDGSGYDWAEIRVYEHNGLVGSDSQSGCSCTGYEVPSVDDINWTRDLAELYRQVDADLADHPHYFSEGQAAEIRMEVRNLIWT